MSLIRAEQSSSTCYDCSFPASDLQSPYRARHLQTYLLVATAPENHCHRYVESFCILFTRYVMRLNLSIGCVLQREQLNCGYSFSVITMGSWALCKEASHNASPFTRHPNLQWQLANWCCFRLFDFLLHRVHTSLSAILCAVQRILDQSARQFFPRLLR